MPRACVFHRQRHTNALPGGFSRSFLPPADRRRHLLQALLGRRTVDDLAHWRSYRAFIALDHIQEAYVEGIDLEGVGGHIDQLLFRPESLRDPKAPHRAAASGVRMNA